MMKTIILALALAAGANADCTIIDPTTLTGIEAGAASGCSGATIQSAGQTVTCSLKCSAGYTCTGTTIHTCTGTTLTAATLATTGCAKDFKQSTNALKTPSTAATASPAADVVGTCVACADTDATTGVEATVFGATAPTCGKCTIIDVSTLTGIVAAGTNGCAGATLKAGSTCGVALDTGYTGTGTTVHSCAGATTATGALTAATLATTGCAANYKQSDQAHHEPSAAATASPTAGSEGTCAACANAAESSKAAVFADAVPTACAPGCTGIPTSVVGIEADTAGTNGPCGATLALNDKCDVKLSAGYTGSGTTVFECKAAAEVIGTSTSVKATLATTGCDANYIQEENAKKTPQSAGTTTADAAVAGTCVTCGTGLTSAAAVFADTAPTCSACPADTMGTAGTCAQGCPVDSFTSAGTTAATYECTACDPTKFLIEGSGGSGSNGIEGDAATLAGTGCGAPGCRVDYYQTAGTPYVAAVVAVTAANAQGANVADCKETAKDVAATCAPTADIYTKQCLAAVSSKAACEAVTTFKADGTADTAKACTYTAAVTNQVSADAANCDAVTGADLNDATACDAVKKTTTGSTTESACTYTAAKAVAEAAAINEVPVTCSKCPIGKVNGVTQAPGGGGAVVAGSEGTCTWCNPYIAGECTSGCPADYYQKTGTTAGTIKCLGCPAGKVLSNAGVLATVQTEAACTTPAAAASGAFRSVANAAATAVAASFAAAALM